MNNTAPTLGRWTAAARRPRLGAALAALGKVAAAALAVQTLALGKGWPMVETLAGLLGWTATAALVAVAVFAAGALLALRRGYALAAADALRGTPTR